jgi:hypothetical protein
MVDILEFIDELKELQALYHSGDLRDFDISTKIQKYERQFAEFEDSMRVQQEQEELFFGGTPFYVPRNEV